MFREYGSVAVRVYVVPIAAGEEGSTLDKVNPFVQSKP